MIPRLRATLAITSLVLSGSCTDDPTAGFAGSSVEGLWETPDASVLYLLEVNITETPDGEVNGEWSGYTTGCTPLNDEECFRSGVVSGARTGAAVTLALAPVEACAELEATMAMTMTASDEMIGTLAPTPCGGPSGSPVSVALSLR